MPSLNTLRSGSIILMTCESDPSTVDPLSREFLLHQEPCPQKILANLYFIHIAYLSLKIWLRPFVNTAPRFPFRLKCLPIKADHEAEEFADMVDGFKIPNQAYVGVIIASCNTSGCHMTSLKENMSCLFVSQL